MLINAQLPIDIALLEHQDQTLSLAGMTWEDYEKFNIVEYPGYRTSFFKGIITLVSPSKNHERIAQTIAILISAYCRKFKIDYFPSNFLIKHYLSLETIDLRIEVFE